jgi:NAD(P)-dependent dehydrogenase (short-subunit alcohol dehydrogenase family)
MSRTILVTGSASGICAATAARLRQAGHKVIGADLRNAEIEIDLATTAGRAALVEQAAKLAPEGLDGVIAGAGVATIENPQLIVAVNYFGALATLEAAARGGDCINRGTAGGQRRACSCLPGR